MEERITKLLDRIDERLTETNLSDRKASMNAVGKPDAIRDIRRGRMPTADRLSRLAGVLGVTADYLLGDTDIIKAQDGIENTRPVPRPQEMVKDIPVYGTAIGADIEFMSALNDAPIAVEQTDINQGEVIDQFRRPPALRERRDVYGLYVAGTSMEPAFESGRGILIDPKRPAAIRDYVVVYMARRGHDHADMDGLASVVIKRLVRRSASYVELEQFNPSAVFKIATKDIAMIHRVMPWDEAFGL